MANRTRKRKREYRNALRSLQDHNEASVREIVRLHTRMRENREQELRGVKQLQDLTAALMAAALECGGGELVMDAEKMKLYQERLQVEQIGPGVFRYTVKEHSDGKEQA